MRARVVFGVLAIVILLAASAAFAFRNQMTEWPSFVPERNKDKTCFDVTITTPMVIRNIYTGKEVERHYLTWEEIQIRNLSIVKRTPISVSYHGTINVGQRVCGLPDRWDIYIPFLRHVMDSDHRNKWDG